jgi:hypothetical protein
VVFNTRTTASNRNIPCKAPAGPSARSRFARWPALSFREVCPAHALSPWAVSLDPLHSSLASASAYAATKSSSCLFRTRPRTAGLCDTPGTAPPLQRTHRSHTLPPTGAGRLSASGACSFFLPRHVCPEASSFHAACLHTLTGRLLSQVVSFTAPTSPRVSRRPGGNTPPVPSRQLSSPICALSRALPRHDWHGCHSLLLPPLRALPCGSSCSVCPGAWCPACWLRPNM